MAAVLLLAAALLVGPRLSAWAAPAQQWQLTAPGGAGPVATVTLDTSGKPALTVRRGQTQVLQSSPVMAQRLFANRGTTQAHTTSTASTA